MEHKIGEIVTLPDGRKVEVVEEKNDMCDGCVLFDSSCVAWRIFGTLGQCDRAMRTDHKGVIYREIKEK